MNPKQKNSAPPPASITLRDIYHVLFRHKWLTAALVVVGLVSALAVYKNWVYKFPYISEAKLYVRYVQDTTPSVGMDGSSNVRSPDERGANILNTEVEMLQSLDTAKAAAVELGKQGKEGMEALLRKPLSANATVSDYDSDAGEEILANFTAEIPPKSDVILLHYKALDPRLPPLVLNLLINAYKTNYMSNHLSMGIVSDFLSHRTDDAKAQLDDAMERLGRQKTKAGVTSLTDSEKSATELILQLEQSISTVGSEKEECEAVIADLQKQIPTLTNAPGTNNSTNIATSAPPESPTPGMLTMHQSLMANVSARQADVEKALTMYTTNSPRFLNVKAQCEAAEAALVKFEAENPSVLAVKSGLPGSPLGPASDPMATLRFEQTRQHSLAARLSFLTNRLAQAQADAAKLELANDDITLAETDKDVADAKYKRLKASLEQSVINSAIGDKISNISTVEFPTPPGRDGKKVLKAAGGVLGFFLALAFGLPFVIEMVLDQSFKQPMDVKARIDAPFFLTIPRTNGRHSLRELERAKPAGLLAANGATPHAEVAGSDTLPSQNGSSVSSWTERRELRPFFETLRDRLMTYFEMINLTHKPKLVAVTSCSEGAGVTTTAAGLASSLSEIGEGNVLLVNMSARDGEAHHFYKGKRDCQIEEVLAVGKRDQAQVQDHLYVVKEMGSAESLPRVLPKRFSHLVPLMKASDYDYIIFDMPPISEISITPRLARFMDMVLLVIESEKTSHEAGTRAAALLAESKTNVGLVLNKNRSYLPKRLQNM